MGWKRRHEAANDARDCATYLGCGWRRRML